MHATHPLPRRALLAALAALTLALPALLPATLDEVSFGLGAIDRGTPASVSAPAPASTPGEPAWQDNPFAYPLLQRPVG